MKKMLLVFALGSLIYSSMSATTFADTLPLKKRLHRYKKHKHKPLSEAKKPPSEKQTDKKDAKESAAKGGVSGTLDLTNNYIFRGISQSRDLPAVQGGLTYTTPVGLYGNIWSSNSNFIAPDGKQTSVEVDAIIGWSGDYLTDFNYDISVARYYYPGARKADYNELLAILGYKIFKLGLGYSDNVYNLHVRGVYLNGTISYDIPTCIIPIQDLNIEAEFGHYRLDPAAGYSYNDYSLKLSKKISDIYSVSAQWTDTNRRAQLPPYDGSHFVATISAAF